MKGVNASRIAALAAGALVLSSSAIAAGLMYENVELVNPNGQPTAKIVVGSGAAISDGVAAAQIASVIANQAYKSSTLTAAVNGQATCAAGGSASGTGTCEISNEKVTLTIELPGVLGNAYQFKTLITDTIDKTLANRNNTRSEDNWTASTTTSDVSTILSPLRAAYSGAKAANLIRVGGSEFSAFADQTAQDPQASSEYTYKEEQGFWAGSGSNGVIYDSGSSYRQVIAKPNIVAYNIRFLGNDYGIPICTKANDSGDGGWSWCNNDSTSQYLSGNHRIKIWFLGEQWVISAMTNPTAADSSSTTVLNGGSIKLAKEAKYDIINVGGVIDGGTFKVRLADIAVATGSANTHPAIVDILDANDAVVGQIQVNPGDTYTFTQSSTGQTIKVHVYRTAPGFTLNAKWAEMAIYTDEITLQDAQRYNLASSGDKNYNVKVSLLWKNRDWSSATSSAVADSLREIVLYDEDTFIGKKMVAGDSYSFPPAKPAYKLTYNGLDLTDADYTTLQVSGLSSTDYPIAPGATDCPTDGTAKWTYHAKLIQIKSDSANLGGSGDILSNYRVDSVLFDPIGRTVNGTGQQLGMTNTSYGNGDTGFSYNDSNAAAWYLNGTQNTSITNTTDWRGLVFYRPSGFTCYLVANLTTGKTNAAATSGADYGPGNAQNSTDAIRYDPAGPESSAQGQIWFAHNNRSLTNTTVYATALNTTAAVGSLISTQWLRDIVIQEDAGRVDTATPVSHQPVQLRLPFFQQSTNVDSDTWRFKASDATTSNTYYDGLTETVATAYEPILYTERGSKVTQVGTTDFSVKVSKKIGMPTFTFGSVSANGTTTVGSDWVAKVGDTKTLSDGAKLTVKDISETVGSCVASTTGGTASCTTNMQGVSARIMPDNVASVEVSQPYDVRGSQMVMTDRDAAGVGGVVITVGGPAVNSVTSDVLKDAAVDFKTTNVVVKAFGSKIVVAGYSAADTLTAANEFIKALQRS